MAFWSAPDPGRLVVTAERPGGPERIVADVRLDGVDRPGGTALVSPDGAWIAAGVSQVGGPGDLVLLAASGEVVWRSNTTFGNFFWSPDGTALAVDHIDGTGLILELEVGHEPVVTPVMFEPPAPRSTQSPAPYRGIHQPLGFSVDGRTLWIGRTMTSPDAAPPWLAIAARVDRASGEVREATLIPYGGDALARANISTSSPEQVAPDGTSAWLQSIGGQVHLQLFPADGEQSPLSVPLGARSATDPVVEGERVFVVTATPGDAGNGADEATFRGWLVEVSLPDGVERARMPLDTGPYVPRLIGSRNGAVLLRMLTADPEIRLQYAAADVESGVLSGFRSGGTFAGWLGRSSAPVVD